MWTDPAEAVVCGYLRVNGYFTLTEFEVHTRTHAGYRTLTDLDVIAVRLPSSRGPARYRGRLSEVVSGIITTIDPELKVAEHRLDILLVEVKQGHIEFNPAITNPAVLHAGLRRIGGELGETLDTVVDKLIDNGHFRSEEAQVRLLAAGSHGHVSHGEYMTLGHMIDFVEDHVETHSEVLRGMHGGDPVIAFLELVQKAQGRLAL